MANSNPQQRRLVFPFEPNYTNVINRVENDVQTAVDAVNTVVPAIASVIPGAATVENEVASVLPGIVPPATPPPAPVIPSAPVPSAPVIPQANVTGLPTQVPPSFEANAREAWNKILPQLQADAEAYFQQYMSQLAHGNPVPQVPNVTYNGQSLTKTAAKGHAIRAFLVGLVTTAGAAILTAIGQQTHVDFFSREGWAATGTLAIGTLVNTAIAYLGRLQIAPEFEKQLAAAPPSVANQLTGK